MEINYELLAEIGNDNDTEDEIDEDDADLTSPLKKWKKSGENKTKKKSEVKWRKGEEKKNDPIFMEEDNIRIWHMNLLT